MITKPVLFGIPSKTEFMTGWLAQLPQCERINKTDAEQWHEETSKNDPNRFAWHFTNLTALSPSEAGEIAQRSLGHEHSSISVEQIIDLKLMRQAPLDASAITRRNSLLEGITGTIFREDYLAQSKIEIIKVIAKHKLGWMRGSIDDVVEVSNALAAVLYSIKNCASSHENNVSLIDQSRLQIFDYLLADSQELAHLPFDELENRTQPLSFNCLLNVQFEFETGLVHPMQVPYDGGLMRTIVESGDAIWMHIVKNSPLPPWATGSTPKQIEL